MVRHGESTANVRGRVTDAPGSHPLTQRGKIQAAAVAEELAHIDVSALLTSPFLRARQTARIIGRRIGLDPEVDDRLAERRFGELAGVLAEKWLASVLDGKLGRHSERWEDLERRAMGFVRSMGARKGTVVAVTHEGIIRGAIGGVMGLDDIGAFGIRTQNCSMTIFSAGPRPRIVAIGVPRLTKSVLAKFHA